MKGPLFCPYCKQTSNRRWNLSTHVIRKHKDQYNPFAEMKLKKLVIFFDSDSFQPPRPEHSKSLSPKFNSNHHLEEVEKLTMVQNVIKEINQMSIMEFNLVLLAIIKRFQQQ